MVTTLNSLERRVLGSLLEKSMAQPDYYPMTEKAIVAACNQKQNRSPVMELDEDAVWETLETLREKGLVTILLPGGGARSKRFKHEAEQHFGWQKRERAVMTELLLRGPQTAGELRTRCSRFAQFEDLAAINIVLDCLANTEQPMVHALPREPGRSAIRQAHLLYEEDEENPELVTTVQTMTSPAPPAPVASRPPAQPSNEVQELREELSQLQERVSALENQMQQFLS
ncbi:MAG: DUF480 domain-containing protein [Planctomycetes bacterium]|nr:DUF480 domain-containing protein [Planctomycetota bacterium]